MWLYSFNCALVLTNEQIEYAPSFSFFGVKVFFFFLIFYSIKELAEWVSNELSPLFYLAKTVPSHYYSRVPCALLYRFPRVPFNLLLTTSRNRYKTLSIDLFSGPNEFYSLVYYYFLDSVIDLSNKPKDNDGTVMIEGGY